MYINPKRIHKLIQNRNRKHPVISLYINTSPAKRLFTELNSLLHTASETIRENEKYSRKTQAELEALIDAVEAHCQDYDNFEGTRSFILFASTDGLWEEFKLPVKLTSQIMVSGTPYMRPLMAVMDEFKNHCVLVVDSQDARIFQLQLGAFMEKEDFFAEDSVPDRVSVSLSATGDPFTDVYGGLGDERIKRHIKHRIHRHLKNVAEKTHSYFREEGFDYLIIAAQKDKILPWLKQHLHSYLQKRLIGEFTASIDTPDSELKEKAMVIAEEKERQREQRIIEEIMEVHSHTGMSVLGLEHTLEALMMGQVHTLVIHHDFRAEGYICADDGIISSYMSECPVCGGKMHQTEHLGEEIVKTAINQGAEVDHIFLESKAFNEYRIGALLRFKV